MLRKGYIPLAKKIRSADKSIAQKVILTSILNKKLWQKRWISSLSSHIGYSQKMILHYLKMGNNLDDSTLEENWVLMCRVPQSDRIVEIVKNSDIQFWFDNTHPSPNGRDIIK